MKFFIIADLQNTAFNLISNLIPIQKMYHPNFTCLYVGNKDWEYHK